ncbi:MAG: tetratricopeptide repeat-containing sensor histidine kinase [Bacteroidota bacterium]
MRKIVVILLLSLTGLQGVLGNTTIDSLLLELDRHQDAPALKAEIHAKLGINYFSVDIQKATDHFLWAIENGQRGNNFEVVAKVNNNLSIIRQRAGQFEEALAHNLQAIEYWQQSELDSTYLGKFYTNLSTTYIYLDKYQRSIESLITSLKIAENYRDTFSLAVITQKIGQVHFSQKNYDLAVDYCLQSKELSQLGNYPKEELYAIVALGVIYAETNQYEKALALYQEGIQKVEQSQDAYLKGNLNLNLANTYLDLNQLDSVTYFLDKALAIFEAAKAELYVDGVHITYSIYYHKMGDFAKSIALQEELLTKKSIQQHPPLLRKLYKQTIKTYTALENFQKANVYQDSLIALEEEHFSEEKLKTAQEAEVKYKSEQKELELAQQATELREKENRIGWLKIVFVVLLFLCLGGIGLLRYNTYKAQKNRAVGLSNIAQRLERVTRQGVTKNTQQLALLKKLDTKGLLSTVEKEQYQRIINELEEIQQKTVTKFSDLSNSLKQKDLDNLAQFKIFVAHDLKTPLVRIKSLLALLNNRQNEPMDDFQTDKLEKIKAAVYSMENVIETLGQVLSLEDFKPQLQLVNLTDLIKEIYEELEPEWRDRTVDFRMTPLPILHTDMLLMRTIFSNLLSNALKFTQDKAIALIKIEGKKNQEEVVLNISDNGIGFDTKDSQRIFQLFNRLPNAKSIQGEGTGLAIVRKITDLLGGTIEAKGQTGSGSTFKITLPLRPTEW